MDKPIDINDMHVAESLIRFQIFSQGKEAARFFDGLDGYFAQYFFGDFSGYFAVVRGAVLEISAVSATFFQNFSSFWTGLGSCFRSFMDYSYPRPVSYQHMAIVHYANLVWGYYAKE